MQTTTETTTEIQRLPEVVDSKHLKGIGIRDIWAKLVKRSDTKAMYVRKDHVYEVFEIKVRKPKELNGYKYPRMEVYPGNEDFGHWAWCFTGKNGYKKAKEQYDFLP